MAAEELQQHAEQMQRQAADYATRVRQVAETDARYTRELANAKNTVDALRRDVAVGLRRLRVAATCQELPAATAPTGVVDDASARLTPDAERAYWRLRTELETASKQITGLQEYIREM
ncbi:lysis protein [Candidatus Regiella insecticola]|uniref:Putative prophage endopeptidase n=1 Tax=Candidatus Regiella insecticola TaxID=138073 RepID=A0A6L2ZRK6_9ENTR|nr:lysis protein [Candidatus Regiella insecticola]GFN47393.1 putative prophage endopeptidase [Candidatus Regiella insecticola]